jgi:hypothetical protein
MQKDFKKQYYNTTKQKGASHQLLVIHFSKLKITIEVTNKKKNFIGWLQQVKTLEKMKET